MSKLISFCIISLLFLSCKTDRLEEVLRTSNNPELDMVFHTIVIKNKINGTSRLIVDKATKQNSVGIEEFDTIKSSNNIVYWNKRIFPNIKFLSQKLIDKNLEIANSKDENVFWKIADNYDQGWIKISQPIFTENKKRAIIVVDYENPVQKFGGTTYYILEKCNGRYKVIKQKLISIS